MKRFFSAILLGLILFVAFATRLYKIDIPVADWHSWRQADTAAVARNFIKDRFDLLLPRYDDISSLQTGQPNPEGYRLVEFPLYNAIIAGVYRLTGVQEAYARLVSVVFALISIVLLYWIVEREVGRGIAFWSALFYAFLPYNIYFTRSIFPEVPGVTLTLAATLLFSFWMDARRVHGKILFALLSTIAGALALLVKPTTIFFFFPLFYLAFRRFGLSAFRNIFLWLSAVGMIAPLLAWRWWISHFPEGIPANEWLLNGKNIRFTAAHFRWIFSERFGKLILTSWGMPLFVFGLIRGRLRDGLFPYMFLLGTLVYVSVFAMGNIQHDYYQILIIPTLAIFLARGADFLARPPRGFSRFWTWPVLVVSLVFIVGFGWYDIRGNYQINHWEIVEAGRVADALLPPDARVIAPYGGDTAFLYQTNRKGWPIVDAPIEELIARGATHYVSVNFDALTQELMEKYPILVQTDEYVILKFNGSSGMNP